MKLINKFLTALAPVAMVGVLTPTLVSCNKGRSYEIHYGDDINCLDPTNPNVAYHSVSDVKNAIKSKLPIQPSGQSVSINQLNEDLQTNKTWYQLLYYEIIASYVSFEQENTLGVLLTEWNEVGGSIESFYLNHNKIIGSGKTKFHYEKIGNEVYIQYSPIEGMFKSYTYQFCEAEE